MTTTVTVKVHCADDKEVEVLVSGALSNVLQNGQSIEVFAYDDRVIEVKEVSKSYDSMAEEVTQAASDEPEIETEELTHEETPV